MNTREGITRKDDTLPLRLLREGRKSDPKGLTVPLEEMLDKYYQLRDYDENGVPTDEALKSLGIVA
jgi:aldehyde:ferredoxin oxidoreductase